MSTNTLSFDGFYAQYYGHRWPAILAAMHQTAVQIGFEANLLKPYFLDPASVLVAQALDVQPADSVLDMCAAPGGKTLVLLSRLSNEGHLVANEPSTPRRKRLIQVIRQHVNDEARHLVEVRGKEGLKYGLSAKEMFDRVLVDAPCSSERHLLDKPDRLAIWSDKRSASLSKKQYALLSSAWLAVKPGGTIVYATCSLSPYENDAVVARLVKRKNAQTVQDADNTGIETTEHGYQILPDIKGWGPMYYSKIKKPN